VAVIVVMVLVLLVAVGATVRVGVDRLAVPVALAAERLVADRVVHRANGRQTL
jgi:hypothetical protein